MLRFLSCATLATFCFTTMPASAQEKTVIKVGVTAGGGYDLAGRVMARHLGKHLGESGDIVVQNVTGASSLNLVKLMAADGRDNELGMMLASLLLNSKLDPEKVNIDFAEFKWIGSLNNAESVCLTRKDSGIETFEDFVTKEFKIGATSVVGGFYQVQALIKNSFGAKFEIVTGFKGLRDIEAAIDRGEIAGYCGSQLAAFIRFNQSETRNLIGSLSSDVELNGVTVPSIISAAKDESTKASIALFSSRDAMYYPVMMAPSTSDETVARYRAAFDAMAMDEAFKAEMTDLQTGVVTKSGAEVQAIVEAVAKTDPAALAKLNELLK
jgi:tripartite-type tricarboxylate transporter receptor subunit TctC